MPARIPDPWLAFLREVDHALSNPVEVHCLGGFVLGVSYDLPRPTGDVDFIEFGRSESAEELLRIAGAGSELARRHKLEFHRVTIAECPEDYASRLTELTPRSFKRLRLRAFEVHDLVLAKLGRNSARDRADVEFLAKKGVLDPRVLETRFEVELRPYLLNEARHAAALGLWLGEFFGDERGQP